MIVTLQEDTNILQFGFCWNWRKRGSLGLPKLLFKINIADLEFKKFSILSKPLQNKANSKEKYRDYLGIKAFKVMFFHFSSKYT